MKYPKNYEWFIDFIDFTVPIKIADFGGYPGYPRAAHLQSWPIAPRDPHHVVAGIAQGRPDLLQFLGPGGRSGGFTETEVGGSMG